MIEVEFLLQLEAEKSGVLNFITIPRCGCSGVFRF